MPTFAQSSAVTALGDTAKTLIGNIQVTQKAKRIIGIWGYCNGGAGNTTLENRSGILSIESGDINISPMELPLDVTTMIATSTYSPRVFPVDIPVSGGEVLSGYMTMDLAQTIANTGRWGIITES